MTLILHPRNSLLVECPDRHHQEPAAAEKHSAWPAAPLVTADTDPWSGPKIPFHLHSSNEQSSRAAGGWCELSNKFIFIVRYTGVL